MAATTRKRQRSLIVGHQMVCPRCKKPHDILTYKPLQVIPEFSDQTLPIYVCPECRWKFAPSPSTIAEHVLVTSAEEYPNDE